MIVYHGSSIKVQLPDIYHSRGNVDFGKGFYITPFIDQAERWSMRFKQRMGQGNVSVYKFDLESSRNDFRVLEFEGYTEEWLDFITSCRSSADKSVYDLVIGGVANDKVFNTIELYLNELIEKREAIKRLQYMKPNLQMCIRNQAMIQKYLKYVESKEI